MNTTKSPSVRPIYSIKFPLVKERVGRRRGPRFRIVPDKTKLFGAQSCAAGMVSMAIRYRDSLRSSKTDHEREMNRLGMRIASLWARVFAGHINADDARIDAAMITRSKVTVEIIARAA